MTRVAGPAARAPDRSVPAWRAAGLLCPVLLDREAELDALRRALEGARHGQGGVAVIVGPAGVGKSRLAREIQADTTAGGSTVLTGRALRSESPLPYRALVQALLGAYRADEVPDVAEVGPFHEALGRLVPGWGGARAMTGADPTQVVGEAVLRLLRAVAGSHGCLVVLEDLHWADPETLVVLEHLVDNLCSEPVLCVATVRSDEASAALEATMAWRARRAGLVVELGQLDPAGTVRMAEACLGVTSLPDGLAEPLWTWTGGVPFLVEELLAGWAGSGVLRARGRGWTLRRDVDPVVPASFAATVRQRLAALGPADAAVVTAAAVLGPVFDWTLLSAMCDRGEAQVVGALARASAAQLITATEPGSALTGDAGGEPASALTGEDGGAPDMLRFRHALTREAIVEGLFAPERSRLGLRALAALEARDPELAGERCELAAELAAVAGCHERAVRLLVLQGRRALAQGALGTAEMVLRRARTIGGTETALVVDVDELLTEVLAAAAKVDQAVEVGGRLLGVGTERPALGPARRAALHLRLGRAFVARSDWASARAHAERARALAGAEPGALAGIATGAGNATGAAPGGEPGARSGQGAGEDLSPAIDSLAAEVALGEGRFDEAVALAESALAAATAASEVGQPAVACAALEVLGRRARLHDLDEAERLFRRAHDLARCHGLTVSRLRALHELALIDMLERLRPERICDARELAYRAGAVGTAADLDLHHAAVLAFHLDHVGALESARRCAESARRFRLGLLLPMALLRVAEGHAVAGDAGAMGEALAEALGHAHGDPDVAAGVWGQCRGLHSLLQERRGRALGEFDTAVAILASHPGANPWVFRGLWLVLHAVEDREADATQAEFRGSAVMVRPVHRGFLGYAEAVTSGRRGRGREACERMARAEAEMGTVGHGGPGRLARRLVAERALRDGWGEPSAWLLDDAAYFDGTGHHRVASACRSLLREAGVGVARRRAGTRVPTWAAALGITGRELEVLALVAAGHSNRAVAERLFVSTRTVHKHMQRLLAKTAAPDRARLVALAVDRGV